MLQNDREELEEGLMLKPHRKSGPKNQGDNLILKIVKIIEFFPGKVESLFNSGACTIKLFTALRFAKS